MELFAKKSLGQHFLNSESVLKKIIDAAEIKKGETILEIGPGTGILTRALLKTGEKVIAIEKDARAFTLLQEKFAEEIKTGQFILHSGDILETNRAEIGLSEASYAVVANIPYYITGAILESFLEYTPRPNRMILLVQKEVADRIVAHDGKESILSISVKAFGEPHLVAKVPRGAFTPPPNVDSAILAINNIKADHFTKENKDIKRFFDILKAGFAHKRKFLKRNLEMVMSKNALDEAWNQQNLDPKLRAEDMSLVNWINLQSNT